jgi:hypothetical protein
MAKRTGLVAALAVMGALTVGFLAMIGAAGAGKKDNGNRMLSFFEVPAISTPNATGRIDVRIQNNNTISFRLRYSGLSAAATAAHIHFAQRDVNGGIVAFLCGGGEAPCPPGTTTPADVSGTILPEEIQGVAAQGIPAGAAGFSEVVAAIRSGLTYANVHNGTFTGGEIRGQIKARGGGDDDD